MAYQLIFSDTAQRFVQVAPTDFKRILKKRLEVLREHPGIGKPLLKRLSGYYSMRTNKFRIIYRLLIEKNTLEVHYIGPRRDPNEIIHQFKVMNSKFAGSR